MIQTVKTTRHRKQKQQVLEFCRYLHEHNVPVEAHEHRVYAPGLFCEIEYVIRLG